MSTDGFYRQVIDGCLARTIGEHGLPEPVFASILADTAPALDMLRQSHTDGSLPLLTLPETHDDLPAIAERARYHRDRAEDVVVLGTGGSSLGGQSLYALADAGFGPSGGAPRLHFMDNIDPHSFDHLFRALDLADTDFVVISKSGGTAETLTQFVILLAALEDAVGPARAAEHVTVITEPGDNPLRQMAVEWDMTVLDHDPGLGGRYSALSLVGLLPAAIAGLDIGQVRDGAHAVLHGCLNAVSPDANPPAVGAALQVGLSRECGAATTVLMPYTDSLACFARWFRQLWAESLGKNGKGTTPVAALGTVDQHSQLQLYLDGPRDKMFSLIFGDVAGTGRPVEADLVADPALGYLAGHRMGDLLDAEQRATAETLIGNGRPTRIFQLGRVDEATLGALMMHFMLETVIAAHLLGVDPFDQPAVEQGKVLARRYLGEMGAVR